MKPALTTVTMIVVLVACGGESRAEKTEPLTEELLLSIYDGERSSAGRAEKLLQTATSLNTDKPTQIALLKKAVEFGLKSLATAKSRHTTETALDRLVKLTYRDVPDSFITDKRIEFYRLCYRL
ncbi:MAG: hypothetical protein H8E53_02870, partial [Planctomycetes bacterium]|nr:hypothetical protein [Planctomycetota bacterium]